MRILTVLACLSLTGCFEAWQTGIYIPTSHGDDCLIPEYHHTPRCANDPGLQQLYADQRLHDAEERAFIRQHPELAPYYQPTAEE